MFRGLTATAIIIILTIIHFQMRLNQMATIRRTKNPTQINLQSSKISKSNLFNPVLLIRIWTTNKNQLVTNYLEIDIKVIKDNHNNQMRHLLTRLHWLINSLIKQSIRHLRIQLFSKEWLTLHLLEPSKPSETTLQEIWQVILQERLFKIRPFKMRWKIKQKSKVKLKSSKRAN